MEEEGKDIVEDEYLFKILIVGNPSVGKTSVIRSFVYGTFTAGYKATIGVDFCLKILDLNEGKTVARLQLWDIAGQERFGNMTRVYYSAAHAAIIVCDNTSENTFYDVEKWRNDILAKMDLETPIPMLMLINKCDLDTRLKKSDAEIRQYSESLGFVDCCKVSAKNGEGVNESIEKLVEVIIARGVANSAKDADVVDINANASSFSLPCCRT